MENRLIVLKDKKQEIFSHFGVRPSKRAFERFDGWVASDSLIEIIRWAHKVTNKTLGLKYIKEYFDGLLQGLP